MKPTVVVIAAINIAVIGLLVYAYLWVLDVGFSGGGVTHWQNPLRVAVLTVLAVGAAVVAARMGLQLFRSTANSRRLVAVYAASSAVFIVAGLIVVFDAVVTQT